MGSLGYCEVCNGEYCMRGDVICCISCGLPKDQVPKTKPSLDELLVGVGAGAEPEQTILAAIPAKKKR